MNQHYLKQEVQPYLYMNSWTNKEWEEITNKFIEYKIDVDPKVIKLMHVTEQKYLILPYKHRFRKKELRKKRAEFIGIVEIMASKHNVAVFLTLTSKPDMSILQSKKAMKKAINNLKAFIRKRYRRLVKHVAVYESHENGRVHVHIILFGIGRIEDYRELDMLLEKWGVGRVHWIKQLRKHKGGWLLEGRNIGSIVNYLLKYLTKNISSKKLKKLAWYWATNTRFYTHTPIPQVKIPKEKRGEWIFVEVTTYDTIKWEWINGAIQILNQEVLEEVEQEYKETLLLLQHN